MNKNGLRFEVALLIGFTWLLAACSSSTGSAKNNPPAPDTTPPQLTAAYPADNFHGFKQGERITLQFSEPMDTASVKSAFRLTGGGKASWPVTFTWENNNQRLLIAPDQSLPYSPNSSYEYFVWELAATAKDVAGNSLDRAYRAKFSTLRTLSARLPAENIDGMTIIHKGTSDLTDTSKPYSFAGDFSNKACAQAFFSFDLSGLPADLVAFKSAVFAAYILKIAGDPYGSLGGWLRLDHLDYGDTLEEADSSLQPLTDGNGNPETRQVTNNWVSDWRRETLPPGWLDRDVAAKRAHFQLRYHFDVCTDEDGVHDRLRFATSEDSGGHAPYVDVEYLVP